MIACCLYCVYLSIYLLNYKCKQDTSALWKRLREEHCVSVLVHLDAPKTCLFNGCKTYNQLYNFVKQHQTALEGADSHWLQLLQLVCFDTQQQPYCLVSHSSSLLERLLPAWLVSSHLCSGHLKTGHWPGSPAWTVLKLITCGGSWQLGRILFL